MQTVQMNTRIDANLKAEGDLALACAGYTPSQAVRALWTLAVKNKNHPEAMRSILDGKGEKQDERQQRAALVESGVSICRDFINEFCLTASSEKKAPAYEELSYDDLKMASLEERLQERGLQ